MTMQTYCPEKQSCGIAEMRPRSACNTARWPARQRVFVPTFEYAVCPFGSIKDILIRKDHNITYTKSSKYKLGFFFAATTQ